MNEEELEAIKEAKKQIEEVNNLNDINIFMTDSTTLKVLLNCIDRLQKENENAKWYIHQMIARINEDIEDFTDDDKEGNKAIIGELLETKSQWNDMKKLLNGESKDNLYNDWRKYGEYE